MTFFEIQRGKRRVIPANSNDIHGGGDNRYPSNARKNQRNLVNDHEKGKGVRNEWTIVRRRRDINHRQNPQHSNYNLNPQNINGYSHYQRPVKDVSFGNRGDTRHRWWRGPREPSPHGLGFHSRKVVSLFVDGISRKVSLQDLRRIFEQEGSVMDVYISGKKRKKEKDSFGFVRYNSTKEALKAIEKLDGFVIHGSKLKVSMAKYQKGGSPTSVVKETSHKLPATKCGIISPALRDHRSYRDILEGRNSRSQPLEDLEHEEMSTQVPIEINKNPVMESRLECAIVVEVEQPYDSKSIETVIDESQILVVCISSLTPNKLILFLEDLLSVENAVSESSPLRRNFMEVHRWSDDECVKERVTWIECIGMHPKCWSFKIFETIGEKWGKVIRMEDDYAGLHSLTCARLLIRTTVQSTIEENLTINWESGSFEVWVKEIHGYGCKNLCEIPQEESEEGRSIDINTQNAAQDIAVQTLEKEADYENLELIGKDGIEPNSVEERCRQNDEGERVHNETLGGEKEVNENNSSRKNESLGIPISSEQSKEDGNNRDMVEETTQILDLQNIAATQEEVGGQAAMENADVDNPLIEKSPEANEVLVKGLFDPLICGTAADLRECEDADWFDPIANLEINVCNSISAQRLNEEDRHSTDRNIKLGEASNKRPRGRPKRVSKTSTAGSLICPPTSSMEFEIQQTWNTVKMLGVSSNDDGAVLSQLRKSKRILNMEHIPS
ncbi:unnamed protein product [Amaranthus hypochondriacus]